MADKDVLEESARIFTMMKEKGAEEASFLMAGEAVKLRACLTDVNGRLGRITDNLAVLAMRIRHLHNLLRTGRALIAAAAPQGKEMEDFRSAVDQAVAETGYRDEDPGKPT